MESSIQLLAGHLHKGTPDSIGYDLHTTIPLVIMPGQKVTVPTGVVTKLAKFVIGLICDRSGLAAEYGLTTLAGVIDPDYDKEWKVILLNTGNKNIAIPVGDRIAQVIFMNTLQDVTVVDSTKAVITYDKEKRTDGFGSTGN